MDDSTYLDWHRILSLTRKKSAPTQGLLNSCKPAFYPDDDTLELTFGRDFTADKFNKGEHLDIMREVLEEIYKREIQIKIEIIKKDELFLKPDTTQELIPQPARGRQNAIISQGLRELISQLEDMADQKKDSSRGWVTMIRTKDSTWIVDLDTPLLNTIPGEKTLLEAIQKCIARYTKVDYHDYLQSDAWKNRAYSAKKKAGMRCQLCNKKGNNGSLHAHHRTYERLGKEKPGDITVLCADCHAKFHNKG